MRPQRAITYARVSTRKTAQETSIRRQVAELKEIATRRGWAVAGQFSDRLSGGDASRPGLHAALDLVTRGAAEILIVHDLDRLGRDVRELLRNVDAIHAAGANLFIVSLGIDTSTPEGRLTFTVTGALAEFQRRDNVRKVIAGLVFARKKGIRLGRPPTMPAAALVVAVGLRRKRPRPSWAEIARQLQAQKCGTFARGTVAGAVTRALSSEQCRRQSSKPARALSPPRARARARAS